MRTFTALLSYDDPTVDNLVVTRATADDVVPHVLEVKSTVAPAGAVDVFELVDGEPLASLALYEFRHTRTANDGAHGTT